MLPSTTPAARGLDGGGSGAGPSGRPAVAPGGTELGAEPATLVGHGRVGKAVARMLGPRLKLLVASRASAEQVAADGQGPVYVATTNDALEGVLSRVPPARHADLVLLQNGWLLPWLQGKGLGGVTQVALYMAAGPDGTASDGKRTVVSGRWSQHVIATLARGGVRCDQVDDAGLLVALVEKQLWACIFWVLSAGLGGKQVGDIVRDHTAEVQQLVHELLPPLRAQLHALAPSRPGAAEAAARLSDHRPVGQALTDYSLSIPAAVPNREMALAEFKWRNGAVLAMGGEQPGHVAWLRRAGTPEELLEAYGGRQG